MQVHATGDALAALLCGVSTFTVQAEMAAPAAAPKAPKFDAQGEPIDVNRSDVFGYKALPACLEPGFISHDLSVVRALCHRVIVRQNGQIVEQDPGADLQERPTTHHTRRLVRAAFEIAT